MSETWKKWTIEPHGDGLVLYSGRDNEHHGLNLVYLKEPAHQWPHVKPLIEAAPELYEALAEAVVQLEYWGGDTTEAKRILAQARGETQV
jgi:hypothetical protein